MDMKKYIDIFCFQPDGENNAEAKEFFREQMNKKKKFLKKINEVNDQNQCAPSTSSHSSNETKVISNDKRNENFYNTFLDKQMEAYKNTPVPNEDTPSITNNYVSSKYVKRNNWQNLTVLDYKDEIVTAVRNNKIVIIRGFTGCGKSTQIPQYIADDCESRGEVYSLIITQPRRVAAKMIASRVSHEIKSNLGDTVGYQIGLDKTRCSNNTKILYCTTGVLLQRFITTSSLINYSHIIIDEVHERSADIDMLLLILKKNILEYKLKTRIVLMSATFDAKLLQSYFTLQKMSYEISPTLIEINSSKSCTREFFTRDILYLDDIKEKINLRKPFLYAIEAMGKISNKEDFEDFLLKNNEQNILFDLNFPYLHEILHETVIEILYHFVEMAQPANRTKGTVLIFLPGLAEIISLMNSLKNVQSRFKWKLFILHSTISLKEQTEVLQHSIDGSRHIILATNIAESSLTVPNVEYVIDFCLCKTLMTCKQSYNMSYLSLEWSSKSSCDQRAGRTGRTTSGQVFRLVPQNFYHVFRDHEIPEFEKIPLDNYILKAKLIDPNLPPKMVLAFALNPPHLDEIDKSILTLKRVGALTVYIEKKKKNIFKQDYYYDPEDGHLTSLGFIMSLLPLDIMLSKLVALGLVFDVLHEAIIIASSHCTVGLFMKNYNNPIYTYKSLLSWSNNSFSDSLAFLKAYKMYKFMGSKFENNASAQKWCNHNNIEYHRLLELETLIGEITSRLKYNLKIGLVNNQRTFYKKKEQEIILKVVISAAFYPFYFIQQSHQDDEMKKFPTSDNNTVILTGFPKDSLTTALYIPALKEKFESCSSKINFKIDGSRVYMTLDSNNYESSIDDEDHTLFHAYSSHVNAIQSVSNNHSNNVKSVWKNCSPLNYSYTNTSVYVALAYKKLFRDPISIHRYMSAVEESLKKQLKSEIQKNNNIFIDKNDKIRIMLDNEPMVAKICNDSQKYLLPKMAKPSTSCLFIGLHITNFLSPHLFFSLYKHSYTKDMLYNINLLSNFLIKNLSQNEENEYFDLQIGDLVIAPLKIGNFHSLSDIADYHNIDQQTIENEPCIMARAEILHVYNNFHPMVYLYYIDYGFKDKLPISEKLIKLKCRFKFSVMDTLRKKLDENILYSFSCLQDIFDMFFCIPPLAIKCQMARIKLFTPLCDFEFYKFIIDYLKTKSFVFNAKIYSFIDDILVTELYPYSDSNHFTFPRQKSSLSLSIYNPSDNISLNEFLVYKKFAEFKHETDLCQHHSQIRDINSFRKLNTGKGNYKKEAPLIFDCDNLSLTEYKININELINNPLTKIHRSNNSKFRHNNLTLDFIRIRGPISSLELKFTGMSKINSIKNVNVSKTSVNIVSLGPSIKDSYSKLLVAGDVSINDNNAKHITLNNTTLMPNIIDFPAFMCLLFAPSVEFRVNKLVNERCFGMPEEICGAICGIGSDPITKESYDPDNDLDFFFESSVNLEDIELINLLRYQISQFFLVKGQHITQCFDENNTNVMFDLERNLYKRQKKCRQTLINLLFRNRIKRKWFNESIYPTFKWGSFEDVNNYRKFSFIQFSDEIYKTINLKTSVFPPHVIPLLNPDKRVLKWEQEVMDNITHIENENFSACLDPETKLYLCKLCMFYTFTKVDIQTHAYDVIDSKHKEAVFLFNKYYSINFQQQSSSEQKMKYDKSFSKFKDFVDDEDDDNVDNSFNLNSVYYQQKILEELTLDDLPNGSVDIHKTTETNIVKNNKLDNIYSINSLKSNINKMVENGDLDIHFVNDSTSQSNDKDNKQTSGYSSLIDYYDHDELLLMNQLNLISDLKLSN